MTLPPDLIRRLKSRAASTGNRNDLSPIYGDRGPGQGTVLTLSGALSVLRGEEPEAPKEEPLAPPVTIKQLVDAEAQLGFALPLDLAQYYTEIANGGVGPGEGLDPLELAVARTLEYLAYSPSEFGHAWPSELLVIRSTNPGADCYHRETGEIVFWDEEDGADGRPEFSAWQGFFKKEAKSLGSWFENWLDTPSPYAPPTQSAHDEMVLQSVRDSIARAKDMTPEERKMWGMDKPGWEKEMFDHLGVDWSKIDLED